MRRAAIVVFFWAIEWGRKEQFGSIYLTQFERDEPGSSGMKWDRGPERTRADEHGQPSFP